MRVREASDRLLEEVGSRGALDRLDGAGLKSGWGMVGVVGVDVNARSSVELRFRVAPPAWKVGLLGTAGVDASEGKLDCVGVVLAEGDLTGLTYGMVAEARTIGCRRPPSQGRWDKILGRRGPGVL